MAERRAQNKFIPNDYDPKQFRTINDYQKGKRTRNSEKEQTSADIFSSLQDRPLTSSTTLRTLTVRFEMPFNIWCTGCENHIGMGVRYNAEKKHVGMYHSSPIFQFRMKCHLCPSYIVIEADPKLGEYVILEGARKRIETYDPKDIGVIVLQDQEETKKLEQDPFYRLEHQLDDTKQAETVAPTLDKIIKHNNHYWKDPYTLSQQIRRKFRTEKKESRLEKDECQALGDRLGLSIEILPENPQDDLLAKNIDWKGKSKEKKHDLSSSSSSSSRIFGTRTRTSKSTRKNPSSFSREKILNLVSKKRGGDPFANF